MPDDTYTDLRVLTCEAQNGSHQFESHDVHGILCCEHCRVLYRHWYSDHRLRLRAKFGETWTLT